MINIRRLLASLLLLLPLASLVQPAYADQKFAIAADGDKPESGIANLAGVAPYFHIYDEKGTLLEVLANPHIDLEFGTGPAAAITLADKGVTVLVARQTPGPKMVDVLDERKVRIVRRVGVVQDVANELKE